MPAYAGITTVGLLIDQDVAERDYAFLRHKATRHKMILR